MILNNGSINFNAEGVGIIDDLAFNDLESLSKTNKQIQAADEISAIQNDGCDSRCTQKFLENIFPEHSRYSEQNRTTYYTC